MNKTSKIAWIIIPAMAAVLQGIFLRIAVWMNKFFPKLEVLAPIVNNIPVAPWSGKSPSIAEMDINYHWDKIEVIIDTI